MEKNSVLTLEECKVLDALAHGMLQKDIAIKNGISKFKVRNILSSVTNKLGAVNSTESVAIAVRKGYIK